MSHKVAPEKRARTIGMSIDQLTLDRIDAVAGKMERSKTIRTWILQGLALCEARRGTSQAYTLVGGGS